MVKSIVQEKSYNFALGVIKLVRKLPKNNECYVISRQLLKSATSVGANIEEALSGYSKDDFIYKMNLSLKESAETSYWLRLLKDSEIIIGKDIEDLINESIEIRKILTSIVKTSKERLKEQKK